MKKQILFNYQSLKHNEFELLKNCTLIIAGPINTRIEVSDFKYYLQYLHYISNLTGLKVIISTYLNELNEIDELDELLKNIKIIRSEDPGLDKISNKRFSDKPRNTSRMLKTTIAGLLNVETIFAIKSRIEILPTNENFISALVVALQQLNSINDVNLVTLSAHYRSLKLNAKKTYLHVPDTFQVMKTQQMLDLWFFANEYWATYKELWLGSQYELNNEQIMGLAYAKLNKQKIEYLDLKTLDKFSLNKTIFRINKEWEKRFMFTIPIHIWGFGDNRITLLLGRSRRVRENHLLLPSDAYKFSYTIFISRHLLKAFSHRLKKIIRIVLHIG